MMPHGSPFHASDDIRRRPGVQQGERMNAQIYIRLSREYSYKLLILDQIIYLITL